MAGRIALQNRQFDTALCLGASGGILREALATHGGARIGRLIDSDLTHALVPQGGLVLDEEKLPIKAQSLDLIVALWGLHHVNDLPGALLQIRHALKPDGLFLAALPGGVTLAELRAAFLNSEATLLGGAQPHIHPFADLQDLVGLMQRAGFALPVADSDMVAVRYKEPLKLLDDLRGMGEANVLTARPKHFLRRDVLRAALAQFSAATQEDGKAVAQFELCYLAGWARMSGTAKDIRKASQLPVLTRPRLPDKAEPKTKPRRARPQSAAYRRRHGQVNKSRGRSHFVFCPSRGTICPSHLRHT